MTTDTVLLATYLIKQNVKVGASGKEHNFVEYVGVKGNCLLAYKNMDATPKPPIEKLMTAIEILTLKELESSITYLSGRTEIITGLSKENNIT